MRLRPVLSGLLIEPPSSSCVIGVIKGACEWRKSKSFPHEVEQVLVNVEHDYGKLFSSWDGDPYFPKWFMTHGYIMVIEEMCEDVIHNVRNYRLMTSRQGGLCLEKRDHIRRLHIAMEDAVGMYGKSRLDIDGHYMLRMHELPEFLMDAHVNMKMRVVTATLTEGDNHVDDASDETDCIVYIPKAAKCLSALIDRKETFFVHRLRDMNEDWLRVYTEMQTSRLANILMERKHDVDNAGAEDRGQSAILNFGYQSLNCTNKRDDMHGLYTPNLTKRYKNIPGYKRRGGSGDEGIMCDGGKSVDKNECMEPDPCDNDQRDGSVTENMEKHLRELCGLMQRGVDLVTDDFGMERLFSGNKPMEGMYNDIHSDFRAGMLSVSITDLVLMHLDNQNAIRGRHAWNVTLYNYFCDTTVKDPMDEYAYRRLHVGIYGRRVLETTSSSEESLSLMVSHLLKYHERVCKNQPSRGLYGTQILDEVVDGEVRDGDICFRPLPHTNKLAQ